MPGAAPPAAAAGGGRDNTHRQNRKGFGFKIKAGLTHDSFFVFSCGHHKITIYIFMDRSHKRKFIF